LRLEFYNIDDLVKIVERCAGVLGVAVTGDGAREVAARSRGTPRVAVRLLRRVRDFAGVAGAESIDSALADHALSQLEVDKAGLDSMDHRYLMCIAENYAGGPVGVDTLAAALSEQRDAIEDVIEPFLLQNGLLQRTPRGRVLTLNAYRHLGVPAPNGYDAQINFLSDAEGEND
jgi:Holliday junction DNA helicase RuvB